MINREGTEVTICKILSNEPFPSHRLENHTIEETIEVAHGDQLRVHVKVTTDYVWGDTDALQIQIWLNSSAPLRVEDIHKSPAETIVERTIDSVPVYQTWDTDHKAWRRASFRSEEPKAQDWLPGALGPGTAVGVRHFGMIMFGVRKARRDQRPTEWRKAPYKILRPHLEQRKHGIIHILAYDEYCIPAIISNVDSISSTSNMDPPTANSSSLDGAGMEGHWMNFKFHYRPKQRTFWPGMRNITGLTQDARQDNATNAVEDDERTANGSATSQDRQGFSITSEDHLEQEIITTLRDGARMLHRSATFMINRLKRMRRGGMVDLGEYQSQAESDVDMEDEQE